MIGPDVTEKDNDISDGNSELEGRYANHFRVGHNAFEFVIDFGQFYKDHDSERFHTRVIVNPAYAKQLLTTLAGSIDDYEQLFGVIKDIQ